MAGGLRFGMVFEAVDRITSPLRGITEALKGPADAARRTAAVAGDAISKISGSYGGLAAMVGGGFTLKEVAHEAEYFRRMGIMSGMANEEVEHLRHTLTSTAQAARISGDDFLEAFKSFKANGGSVAVFEQNAKTLAAGIQLLGGHGEELGEMFANLQTKMGLTKGTDFLDFLSTAKGQLAGIEGGMDAFSGSAQQLMSDYAALGHTGLTASKELSAIYSVIARGTGNARQAKSMTEGFISMLRDPRGQQPLLNNGFQIYNKAGDITSGVRPATEILKDVSVKFAENPVLWERQLGSQFAQWFKVPIGEIKATGSSATLDKALGAQGDGAKFMALADEASKGLTGSINQLHTALKIFGEENLAGPINLFAKALSACTGPIATVLMTLAGVSVLGQAIGFVLGAAKSFRELWAVLQMVKLGSLIGALPGLVAGIWTAVAATWAWTVALLANPITWVVAAIIAVVAVIAGIAYAIYANWGAIAEWFSGLWDGVKAVFGAFSNWLSSTFGIDIGRIAQSLLMPWLPLIDGFKALWTDIGGVFDWAWSKIGPIVDAVSSGARSIASALGIGGGDQPQAGGAKSAAPAPTAFAPAAPTAYGKDGGGRQKADVTGQITFRFENLPQGIAVSASGSAPGIDFGIERGYAMAGS